MIQSYLLRLLFLLLVSFAAGSVQAQVPADLNGRRVVSVEVAGVTSGFFTGRDVGIPLGARVSRRLLRSTVKRLVAGGQFRDVQLDLAPQGDGVRVIAHLVPRVLLARIEIRDNNVLDDATISRLLHLAEDSEYREEDVDGLAAQVENAYREQGYESVRLEVILRETDDPTRKVLIVRMHEGDPTPVFQVVFDGDQPPSNSLARSTLSIDPGDRVDRPRIAEQIRVTEEVMRERGWLETELGEPTYRRTDRGIEVSIPSHVGPRYEVRVQGHEPLPRTDVEEALELKDSALTTETLHPLRERIVDLYQQHGFLDAAVLAHRESTTVVGRPPTARLLIEVVTGAQLDVVAIGFPGTRHFSTNYLRHQVASVLEEDLPGSTAIFPIDTEVVDILGFGGSRQWRREVPPPLVVEPSHVFYESSYREAVEHVEQLLNAEGYLNAQVGPARLRRERNNRGVVEIPVLEGPRTRLSRLTLRGNETLGDRQILNAAALIQDQPVSYLALEEAKTRVTELYEEHGYFFVRVNIDVRFSGDHSRAEVLMEVSELYPVQIGRIIVEGLDRTSESLILERIGFGSGDTLRPSSIRHAQEQLMSLGIFRAVNISAQDPELPARIKPVVVTVSERLPQFVDVTMGISTGQGIRGSFAYGYQNLLGYALFPRFRMQAGVQPFFLGDNAVQQRLDALPFLSRVERNVSLELEAPHLPFAENVTATVGAFHQRDNERDFGLDKNGVGLTLRWQPTSRFSIMTEVNLEFNNVELLIGDSLNEFLRNNDDPRLERLLRVPEGASTIVSPGFTANLDLRDNPFNSTSGFFAAVSAHYAQTLSSEDQVDLAEPFRSHFIKIAVTASAYIPLPRDFVLAGQLQIGRVFHLEDDSRTYPNRAFYLGGVESLRGYQRDGLIPQDVAEQVARDPNLDARDVSRSGDAYVAMRLELRFPLVGPLHGGAFFEAGNLWSDPSLIFDDFGLRPNAGIGLRLTTPIVVAIDYGFLLVRREALAEPVGALHFYVGLF